MPVAVDNRATPTFFSTLRGSILSAVTPSHLSPAPRWHRDPFTSALIGVHQRADEQALLESSTELDWFLAPEGLPTLKGEAHAVEMLSSGVFRCERHWLFDTAAQEGSEAESGALDARLCVALGLAAALNRGKPQLCSTLTPLSCVANERGATARMRLVPCATGAIWVIEEGSRSSSKDPTAGFGWLAKWMARVWVEQGWLRRESGIWVVSRDIECPSALLAAGLLLRTQGRLSHWHIEGADGKTLQSLLAQ